MQRGFRHGLLALEHAARRQDIGVVASGSHVNVALVPALVGSKSTQPAPGSLHSTQARLPVAAVSQTARQCSRGSPCATNISSQIAESKSWNVEVQELPVNLRCNL